MTGFQLCEVKKSKPKARQAGSEPCTSEIMTPARITSTAMAEALRQDVEGAVADAKAAQDPGALLVIPDPDLNGHGLKRHVHASRPLLQRCCKLKWKIEAGAEGGCSCLDPDRPLVHGEDGLSGGVLDLCPLPAGERNNVVGHRDVIELFGHLSAVLIRPVEEFEC